MDDKYLNEAIIGNRVMLATYSKKGNLQKIGRASCRERVQISVVAVSLKKKIKDELKDMETSVTEDMGDKKLKDEDIFRINEKIKELEKQILNVIEG